MAEQVAAGIWLFLSQFLKGLLTIGLICLGACLSWYILRVLGRGVWGFFRVAKQSPKVETGFLRFVREEIRANPGWFVGAGLVALYFLGWVMITHGR